MTFVKIIKAEDNDLDKYSRYIYKQLEDIQNGVISAKISKRMSVDTLKDISYHLSKARLLINKYL